MGGRGTKSSAGLRLRFWGVRGSHPTPGPQTVRYGGNSSCVEITAGDVTMIFDAGTGVIDLGRHLVERCPKPAVHIFLSHLHHDHIEGLRYFAPAYRKEWRFHLYGPGAGAPTLESTLRTTMARRLFPVSLAELPAHISIQTLSDGAVVRPGIRGLTVKAYFSKAHPKVGVLLYRIELGGRSIIYATDVEGPKGGYEDVVEVARDADVLIHDSQYDDPEYTLGKIGWGHSTARMAAEAARDANVGRLLLFHHEPTHDDREVERLERQAQAIFPRTTAAYEGLELDLSR